MQICSFGCIFGTWDGINGICPNASGTLQLLHCNVALLQCLIISAKGLAQRGQSHLFLPFLFVTWASWIKPACCMSPRCEQAAIATPDQFCPLEGNPVSQSGTEKYFCLLFSYQYFS